MADIDTPETDTPNFNDEEKGAYNVINKIWQEGWQVGHKAGWRGGYREGKTAINQGWAMFAIVVAFVFGMAVAYSMDFVHTCVPIALGEEKSCVTRIGE